MRLHALVAAVGAALILSGCVTSRGLDPQGQLTDPTTLHADRTLSRVAVSPAGWPSADWWTGLGDSQLTSLIEEALKDNPDLASADAAARDPPFNVGAGAAGAHLPGSLLPSPPGNHFSWTKFGYGNFS